MNQITFNLARCFVAVVVAVVVVVLLSFYWPIRFIPLVHYIGARSRILGSISFLRERLDRVSERSSPVPQTQSVG